MDFIARIAFVALICAFMLNAVVTMHNLEKDKILNALEKDLDALRMEVRAERDARAAKDKSGSYLVYQKEAELRNELAHMQDGNAQLAKRVAALAAALEVLDPRETISTTLGSKELPSITRRYPRESLVGYMQQAKALFDQAAKAPWKHLKAISEFEASLSVDVTRFLPAHLPLDDLEHLLTAYVRLKLHAFQQFPSDSCNEAPLLNCALAKSCGFGCQIHHLADCLIVAHKSGRQLVMNEWGWVYDTPPDDDETPHSARGWQYFFRPLHSCVSPRIKEAEWNPFDHDSVGVPTTPPGGDADVLDAVAYLDDDNIDNDARVVSLMPIDGRPAAQWVIYYVPPELLPIIKLFHPDPPLWYLSQIVTYLLRVNDETSNFISAVRSRLKFNQPAIGIHVRRTDKVGVEAQNHELREYADRATWLWRNRTYIVPSPTQPEGLLLQERRLVDAQIGLTYPWLSLLPSEQNTSLPSSNVLAFVATDDAAECAQLLLANNSLLTCNFAGANSADVLTRYSRLSLLNLLADVFLLAECEVFVGTFSSQVSRLVYELAQAIWRPAISSVRFAVSLDDGWYYAG